MSLTFAFVMDPIERVNIRTDTSFALMLAASNRGHQVIHVAPHEISLAGQLPVLSGRTLELHDRLGDHFRVISQAKLKASECDVIVIRTDPPF